MRAVSICRPKSLNSLGCCGGKASQTPNFMGNDKALARATFLSMKSSLTPGTKVGQVRESQVQRLKNRVFSGHGQ